MWRGQGDDLAETARILTVDLPGFGSSAGLDADASLDSWADGVEELIDHLFGTERATVGGLSMGGYVALRFAERHPDRLKGLILADTRAAPDSEETRAARTQTIFKVRRHGMAPLAEDLLPRLLSPRADEAVQQFAREMILAQRPEATAVALAAMRDRPDSSPVLEKIQVPTLVIVGSEDSLTPPEEAEALARSIPDAWLVRIPGAGHLSNLEAPIEFNHAVGGFMLGL
jgi:pimeloyl-ACP methyl ester carboxylesterase